MKELEYIIKRYNIKEWDLGEDARMPLQLKISRWNGFVELLAELGYKVGAEIGVEQGKYSATICRANPGVKLFCIDPWMTYMRYADHVSQPKLDRYYDQAVKRLRRFNCEIIRKTSMEAVKDFEPESLDFVYIDGNHAFSYVVNDIIYWERIVRPGGIVSGHDYRSEGKERIPIPFHVIQAVNGYTSSYKIRPWFIVKKDSSPSWFWVKQ